MNNSYIGISEYFLNISGHDPSAEFTLQEGQQLEITCTGNIEKESQTSSDVNIAFLLLVLKLIH